MIQSCLACSRLGSCTRTTAVQIFSEADANCSLWDRVDYVVLSAREDVLAQFGSKLAVALTREENVEMASAFKQFSPYQPPIAGEAPAARLAYLSNAIKPGADGSAIIQRRDLRRWLSDEEEAPGVRRFGIDLKKILLLDADVLVKMLVEEEEKKGYFTTTATPPPAPVAATPATAPAAGATTTAAEPARTGRRRGPRAATAPEGTAPAVQRTPATAPATTAVAAPEAPPTAVAAAPQLNQDSAQYTHFPVSRQEIEGMLQGFVKDTVVQVVSQAAQQVVDTIVGKVEEKIRISERGMSQQQIDRQAGLYRDIRGWFYGLTVLLGEDTSTFDAAVQAVFEQSMQNPPPAPPAPAPTPATAPPAGDGRPGQRFRR